MNFMSFVVLLDLTTIVVTLFPPALLCFLVYTLWCLVERRRERHPRSIPLNIALGSGKVVVLVI